VTNACPAGHPSTTTDYCDVCGAPMTGSTQAAPEPEVLPSEVPPSEVRPPEIQRCANCGEVREGRFCEMCGFDSELPGPAAGPATLQLGVVTPSEPPEATPEPAPVEAWTAVVRADREWFDEVRARGGPDADTLEFPRYCPDRRFTLAGSQMAIGRGSRSRGIQPEIDLSGPPLDPGVSALHALLVARRDGGWEVVDLDSTNGTVVDGDPRPIPPNTPVPLADGARIKLGAWTTITLHARESGN
jgi:hypothetical protein